MADQTVTPRSQYMYREVFPPEMKDDPATWADILEGLRNRWREAATRSGCTDLSNVLSLTVDPGFTDIFSEDKAIVVTVAGEVTRQLKNWMVTVILIRDNVEWPHVFVTSLPINSHVEVQRKWAQNIGYRIAYLLCNDAEHRWGVKEVITEPVN